MSEKKSTKTKRQRSKKRSSVICSLTSPNWRVQHKGQSRSIAPRAEDWGPPASRRARRVLPEGTFPRLQLCAPVSCTCTDVPHDPLAKARFYYTACRARCVSLLQDMMHGVSRFMRKSKKRLELTNWCNFSSHTHHPGMLARSALSGNCSCGSVFTFWQEHLEKELPLGLGFGFFWLLGTFCLLTG